MLLFIILLVVVAYIISLVVRWILEPFLDWRQDGKNHGIEDSIKWNSDQADPSALLNLIHNSTVPSPSSRPGSPLYLSIVVPSYNESQRLAAGLLPNIKYLNQRALLSTTFRFEIIIVDDGSTDNTTEVAVQLSKSVTLTAGEIRIVQLKCNRGKGFATRVGVQCSRGQYVLMVDADGATLFSDIEKLESALAGKDQSKERGRETPDSVEVVGQDVCGRSVTVRTTGLPSLSTMSSLSYDIAVGSRHQLEKADAVIKDTQCGFKLFTRDSARSLFTSLHIHRWAFDVELFVLASQFNYRVIEIPVTWTEVAGSKLNAAAAAFQMTRDLITVKLFYYFGVWHPNRSVSAESSNRAKST